MSRGNAGRSIADALPIAGSFHTELGAYAGARTGDRFAPEPTG